MRLGLDRRLAAVVVELEEALDRELLLLEADAELAGVIGRALEEVLEAALGVVGQRVDVRDVLLGRSDRVKVLASEPGTLAFFRGRYSLHRVPPIGGSIPRMNSVLTYTAEPGHKLSAMAQQMYYGRTA